MSLIGDRVCALIREKGIGGLSWHDGCACGDFKVLGVEVEYFCHRTSREGVNGPAVFVWGSVDTDEDDLKRVAALVTEQMRETWHYDDISARALDDRDR